MNIPPGSGFPKQGNLSRGFNVFVFLVFTVLGFFDAQAFRDLGCMAWVLGGLRCSDSFTLL